MAPALLETSKNVCVMDASGFLGSNLVDALIQRGYTVHAAVQNHGDLQQHDKKNLRVFQSDPLDYRSIIQAIKGCSALFYSFELPPDQALIFDEFMVDEEVRAAHNVLEACAQTETIEKVVFTSSAAAVLWKGDQDNGNPMASADIDERSWSDVNFCKKFKLWHALSKTLAEKTAWALAADRGVHMVSINPGLVMGPDLSIKNPYLKGAAEMYERGVLVTTDVKHLAKAHVCVFEDSSAYGRYICFNQVINHPESAVKFTQMLTPSAAKSSPQSFGDAKAVQQRISCRKLEKAMVQYQS